MIKTGCQLFLVLYGDFIFSALSDSNFLISFCLHLREGEAKSLNRKEDCIDHQLVQGEEICEGYCQKIGCESTFCADMDKEI